MVAISSRCAKLLAAAKIVVAFMAKGSKEHVISFLLSELSFIDAIPNSVRKSSTCPYFNVVSGSTGSSNSHSRAKSDSTVIQVSDAVSFYRYDAQHGKNAPNELTNLKLTLCFIALERSVKQLFNLPTRHFTLTLPFSSPCTRNPPPPQRHHSRAPAHPLSQAKPSLPKPQPATGGSQPVV